MKTILFTALCAFMAADAFVIPLKNNKIDSAFRQKRQISPVGIATSLLGMGGKVPDPPGAAPKKATLSSKLQIPGAKAVKIRYGPYSVINMQKVSLLGESGMLWNYPDTDIEKPCNDCTLLGLKAGLEYPDGKDANIDTGLWLHHMVHFTNGAGRQDATCGGNLASMPHIDIGQTPLVSERLFASGNERSPIYLTDAANPSNKVGYHLRSSDSFAFIVDLMNMNMEDKTVYVTITYDYLDGFPAGFDNVRPVWLDVFQCGLSEVPAKSETQPYTVVSQPWKPNFEGKILDTVSHLHDGGERLEISVNGKVACDSKAKYGETPGYVLSNNYMAMGNNKMAKNHISSMTFCRPGDGLATQNLSKDQSWTITGYYDYSKNAGNIEGGKQDTVMAIALLFVQVPRGSYAS